MNEERKGGSSSTDKLNDDLLKRDLVDGKGAGMRTEEGI